MKSKYASAARADKTELLSISADLIKNEYLETVFNALPNIAAIINKERQVVFSNKLLLATLGFDSIDQLLGKRPGEAIQCINSENNTGGCGTSENCSICGAVNTIVKALILNEKTEGVCRISSQTEQDGIKNLEFQVTATPFEFKNERFVILIFTDISDVNRKKALERIFFHDILNHACGLKGLTELLLINRNLSGLQDPAMIPG